MAPAFDSGEDFFGLSSPNEGLGMVVGLGEEAVDGILQLRERSEHAALEATAGELGEEAFDRIEPGCGGRGEVERPAGMPGQPLAHPRMLVGRIVVDDGVDYFPHRDLLLDRVEEADELLMPVALHVAADDGAVEDVEGGKQRGRAVPFISWGIVPARPGFIGNPGWVRSRAWIWLFSSTERTTAWAGGST